MRSRPRVGPPRSRSASIAELGDRIWVQEEPFFEQGGGATGPTIGAPDSEVSHGSSSDARLAAAAANARLMAILDQLIGPGHRLIQDMALMKPPLKGSEKPWHQDNAYFDWTPLDGILGVWIALDEATVENGCMQIVPGSQLDGPAQALPRARLPARRSAGRGGADRGRAAQAGRRPVLLRASSTTARRPTSSARAGAGRSSSTTPRRTAAG